MRSSEGGLEEKPRVDHLSGIAHSGGDHSGRAIVTENGPCAYGHSCGEWKVSASLQRRAVYVATVHTGSVSA